MPERVQRSKLSSTVNTDNWSMEETNNDSESSESIESMVIEAGDHVTIRDSYSLVTEEPFLNNLDVEIPHRGNGDSDSTFLERW